MGVQYKKIEVDFPLTKAGKMTLNLALEEHANYVFDRLGGKDFLKTKYPAIYQQFCNLREKAMSKDEYENADDMQDETVNMDIQYKTRQEIKPLLTMQAAGQAAEGNETYEYVYASTNLHTAEAFHGVMIAGKFINPKNKKEYGDFLESYDPTRDYSAYVVYNMEHLLEDGCEDVYGVFEIFGAFDPIVLRTHTIPIKGALSTSIVKSFTVNKMNDKLNNNPLIVLYARTAGEGEKPDKEYANNKEDTEKHDVEVCMPLSGTIEFTQTILRIEHAEGSQNKITMNFSDSGGVPYNGDVGKMINIKNDKKMVSFQIPKIGLYEYEDWHSRLNTARFGAMTTLSMQAPFALRLYYLSGGVEKSMVRTFTVSSKAKLDTELKEEYYKSTKTTVYIPPISVRWGCFAANTRILVSKNGDWKMAKQLKIGDTVVSSKGELLTINSLTQGIDEYIVRIETKEGNVLMVSARHPIESAHGIVEAASIRPRDLIKQYKNGEISEVRVAYCYLYEYQDMVYGIATSGGSQMLIAEGFLAGNSQAQDTLDVSYKEEASNQESLFTEQLKGLVQEMKVVSKQNKA